MMQYYILTCYVGPTQHFSQTFGQISSSWAYSRQPRTTAMTDCESYNKLDGRVGWTLCSLSQNQIKKESCILAPAGCWHLHVSVFPWQHSQSDYISTIWQFKYPIQLLPGRGEYIDIKWLWWSSGGVKIVTILSFSIILYTFIPFLSKRPPVPLWLVFWRWSSSVTLNCP